MSLRFKPLLVLPLMLATNAHALFESMFDGGEWKAEIGAEYRYFKNPGEFGQEQNAWGLRLQSDYFREIDDDTTFNFVPFLRVDTLDSERNHIDIREALWARIGNAWELKAGVSRVHWGKTEFLNVVDVINQKDFVEGDKDEKLGQPLVGLSLEHEWGNFDAYLLLGFRERPFPGEDGRLRTPILVDDEAVYDQGEGEGDVDFAARWRRQLTDELEMGLSLFSGIDREPSFGFNFDFFDPRLVPYYHHKDQIGLELEYIYEGWIGKLEAIHVSSAFQPYDAAVVGGEYTFGAIFESDLDLTLIAEYLWDERNELSPGFFEHDIGLGTRLTFNDVQSTEILFGGLFDPDSKEKVLTLEAKRRLGDSWQLKLNAQSVLDRGESPLSPTVADAVARIQSSGAIDSSLNVEFIADFLQQAIDERGLLAVLTALSGPDGVYGLLDSPEALEALNQLARLTDADRKLGIIESDDYVQLEMTYFY